MSKLIEHLNEPLIRLEGKDPDTKEVTTDIVLMKHGTLYMLVVLYIIWEFIA